MYKTIIIFLLVILPCLSGLNAQPKLTEKEADAKTFALYNAGRWDDLIALGETAIENNTDFFYLRMRVGIAYYSKSDYMSAIPHFEKAVQFNRSDVTAQEYLYYSYVFSGRESDALALMYDMPFKLKKKLDVYSKFIYGVYAEGGYTTNSDYDQQKKFFSGGFPNIYNEQEVVKSGSYISLNLSHQLGKNVKVFQGYNNISVDKLEQIFEQSAGQRTFDLKSKQDEYYLNVNFNLGNGFDLTPAIHYLRVNYDDVDLIYDKSINPWRTVFAETKTTLNDFVFFLSLTKNTDRFRLGFKNSISNLNRATQVQNAAQVVYFPLGNLNLYTITDAVLFSNREWGSKFKSYGIVDQKIGWKTFDFLWMEAGYTFGKIFNYSESDAYIVFNNTLGITDRITVNLITPVSRHIELSLRYQHYNQETPSVYFETASSTSTIFKKNSNHKIIGGIKWTF